MEQRSSFERLTLPHLDAAFNLAFWLVRSEADAEDIVQDAYVRAFRGFHGQSRNLSTYLQPRFQGRDPGPHQPDRAQEAAQDRGRNLQSSRAMRSPGRIPAS